MLGSWGQCCENCDRHNANLIRSALKFCSGLRFSKFPTPHVPTFFPTISHDKSSSLQTIAMNVIIYSGTSRSVCERLLTICRSRHRSGRSDEHNCNFDADSIPILQHNDCFQSQCLHTRSMASLDCIDSVPGWTGHSLLSKPQRKSKCSDIFVDSISGWEISWLLCRWILWFKKV